MADEVRNVTFHVRRFDPEKDSAPRYVAYKVPVKPGMVVLEGLWYIKENLDASLAWRVSCRMGVCGSCGMLLNGHPTLACNTQILDIATTDLVVAPLPNFPLIRDLLPDLAGTFEKHRSVMPFIAREDASALDSTEGEHYQTPEELEHYLQFTYCIKCGCCAAACPTFATDPDYLTPLVMAQAYRYNVDTRDGGRKERAKVVGGGSGAFRCHYAGECSRACPKGVDPARAIQLLKRQLVMDYLHLAKGQKPCAMLHGKGEGKPLPDIPPAPARTV
jgi:succinate dehydrogenase / fumarate reductase, iron-sulfur subunit